MDRLVKPDLQELCLPFARGRRCCATFKLTNLMHTMSVAVSLTTTNPSLFNFSQPFSVIPPLSTSAFTLSLSHTPTGIYSDQPPLSSPPDSVLVRSSMLPTGKAHHDDLRQLFSKPGPHIFRDAALPVSFVGPHVVESLILAPSPKSLEVAFLLSKAILWCDRRQLTSLLRCSARRGNADVASALIEAGADVNDRDKEGQSAMSLAVKSGNIGVVQVLIESGYSMEHSVDLFLHDAAAMNRLDILEILCLGYSDIDMNSTDSRGQTALHLAAHHGHLDVVRFLVSEGSDPDVVDGKGWAPLHYATRKPTSKPSNSCDDLHRAARTEDDVEAIKNCLGQGAKVNSRDQNGWTPLHRAAFKGRIESVKVLINHGAEVDKVNDIGYTPLHLAVEAGHMQVALCLMAHGARANLKSLKAELVPSTTILLL
nr:ankyrin-3-like [Coffea arabica]